MYSACTPTAVPSTNLNYSNDPRLVDMSLARVGHGYDIRIVVQVFTLLQHAQKVKMDLFAQPHTKEQRGKTLNQKYCPYLLIGWRRGFL